jgi:hypothetical protein
LTSLETAQPNAILNPLSPAFPNDIEMNTEPFIPIKNQDEAAPIAAGNEVWQGGSVSGGESSDDDKVDHED